jgi:hypothetical protein
MAHRSNRDHRLYPLATAWVLLCAAPLSHADTLVYKWIDKSGVVSYSQNKPTEQGAHDVTTIRIDSLPPGQQRAASRMLANLEKLSDAETAAREKRLATADARIDAALQHLQQAEHELSASSTPTGEDRVGNVGGHARLRDSYFARLSQLQANVDQAQQALNDAYVARNQP